MRRKTLRLGTDLMTALIYIILYSGQYSLVKLMYFTLKHLLRNLFSQVVSSNRRIHRDRDSLLIHMLHLILTQLKFLLQERGITRSEVRIFNL